MIKDPQLRLKIRLLSLLSMIMVIYVHAYTLESNGYAGALVAHKNYNTFIQDFISQGVTRVASPLFFIISGFLFFYGFKFESRHILRKYKKRVSSLLIPFLLWSAFGIGLYYMLQLAPPLRPFFTNRIIVGSSFSELLFTLLIDPIPYQLWFLRDLIMLVIISPFIWLLVRYLRGYTILALMAAWVLDIDFIVFTSGSILFYSFGCLLAIKPRYMNRLLTTYRFRLPLLAWLGLLIFKTELIYFDYADTLTLMLLHKAALLIGMYGVWVVINYLVDHKRTVTRYVLKFSVSSFFIYAFHEPILSIMKRGLLHLFQSDQGVTEFLVFLLAPLVVILICIVVAGGMKRYIPWLFNLLTGNRPPVTYTPERTIKQLPPQYVS